ncbi:MAG: alpha/beta fold hydrolase [Methylomonas sp.]
MRRKTAHRMTFRDMLVTVHGAGRPMLMIPGLNTAAAVWDETCQQLLPAGLQCHTVQLPGFAGQPAITQGTPDQFLAAMRDRLLDYITVRRLHQPIVMGHSLGGILALEMALKAPDAIERLIIVDALPFSPASLTPYTTAADIKAMAEEIRFKMLNSPIEVYQKQLKASVAGMARSAEHVKRLAQWWIASDRTTSVQAIYEMFITDLRADLAAIPQPTLVLGAWAGLAIYGSTQASVRKTFEQQYRALRDVRIELSEAGHHFLMWDDTAWLAAQIRHFIEPAQTRRTAMPNTSRPEPQ